MPFSSKAIARIKKHLINFRITINNVVAVAVGDADNKENSSGDGSWIESPNEWRATNAIRVNALTVVIL